MKNQPTTQDTRSDKSPDAGNRDQAACWNGDAGHAWVEGQDMLDGMFKPLEDMLVGAIQKEGDSRVLDIGCGTGGTTLAAARRIGPKAQCVGIDISAPMTDMAKARAKQEGVAATFLYADAQTHVFEPASFDLVISRFGVMFFDDAIAAFENLKRAAREQAMLQFIAWRGPDENPFMTTAERAAASLLPQMPARRPDEPGQFAFANRDRVHGILRDSGWGDIHIEPVDVVCTFPERDLVRYLSRMGPLGRVLREADEQTRERVIAQVRPAFDTYVREGEVRYVAACWKVSARAMKAESVPS